MGCVQLHFFAPGLSQGFQHADSKCSGFGRDFFAEVRDRRARRLRIWSFILIGVKCVVVSKGIYGFLLVMERDLRRAGRCWFYV
jgi:hypothetical protein